MPDAAGVGPGAALSSTAFPGFAAARRGSSTAFEIFRQALAPALAPKTALAVAAEAGSRVEQIRGIDPDDAGLDARGDFERAIDVLAPD